MRALPSLYARILLRFGSSQFVDWVRLLLVAEGRGWAGGGEEGRGGAVSRGRFGHGKKPSEESKCDEAGRWCKRWTAQQLSIGVGGKLRRFFACASVGNGAIVNILPTVLFNARHNKITTLNSKSNELVCFNRSRGIT